MPVSESGDVKMGERRRLVLLSSYQAALEPEKWTRSAPSPLPTTCPAGDLQGPVAPLAALRASPGR